MEEQSLKLRLKAKWKRSLKMKKAIEMILSEPSRAFLNKVATIFEIAYNGSRRHVSAFGILVTHRHRRRERKCGPGM